VNTRCLLLTTLSCCFARSRSTEPLCLGARQTVTHLPNRDQRLANMWSVIEKLPTADYDAIASNGFTAAQQELRSLVKPTGPVRPFSLPYPCRGLLSQAPAQAAERL
jgi:hypothetical protein